MEINTIHCGDCVDIMKYIPDNFIDLTITSPPYDEIRDYKGYTFDFESIAKELYRVTKDGGVVVWVVGDSTVDGSETGTSFRQSLYFKDVCGFNIHDTMIYKKKAISFPSNTRYHQCFEYMFVLSKGQPKTFNALKDKPNVVENKKRKFMSQRQKSGETVRQNREISMDDFGMRWNIWEYSTGWMHNSKDKEAFEHPACVDTETECLTINGWKKYNDISPGDTILSYNIENDYLEWDRIVDISTYYHSGTATYINGRRLSILTNEDHRNVAKHYGKNNYYIIKSRDLKKSHKIKVSSKIENSNQSINVDNDLAAILGWYFTEGCYHVACACISQSISANPQYVENIEFHLKNLGAEYKKYERTRYYIFENGKFSHSSNKKEGYKESIEAEFYIKGDIKNKILELIGADKKLPVDILKWDIKSLEYFFDACICGDGSYRKNSNGFLFTQKSYEDLDIIQSIGTLLGYNTYVSYKNRYVQFINEDGKLLRNSNGTIIQKINYEGVMWCPQVSKNKTFVARRNGKQFITGNTFPESLAEDHILSWSNEGDVVLDPMCGSGTTPKMSVKHDRNYIGIDVSDYYCKIARKRIENVHKEIKNSSKYKEFF